MRKLLSIVLAVLLIILPVEQVLAVIFLFGD